MLSSFVDTGPGEARSSRVRLRIAVAALLLFFAPCGFPRASAGMHYYSWGPIIGSGFGYTFPEYQPFRFSTTDGSVTIGYDPDSLQNSFIGVSTGSAGYGVDAPHNFYVSAAAGGVFFSAIGIEGVSAYVSIAGNPGPLNSDGNPESLDSLVDVPVTVSTGPGYHYDQFSFSGYSLPEPSSLLTLALGLGGVAIASAGRRMKKRPGPCRLAGR